MDEILFQAGKFRLVKRFIDSNGKSVAKELILHPGSAAVLPITDDGKVVMVSNYRWAIGRELLELPGGTMEPLEKAQTCAIRELEEETGFSAGTIRPLCRFYASPGNSNELMHVFVASELKPGPQQLDADERISVQILGFDQINQELRDGKIVDGKTLAALLYYQMLERP